MPKNHSNTVHKKNWKNKVHTSNIIPSQYTRTRVASILSFHNRILFFSRSTMYIVLYIKGPNNCESVGEKLGHQTEEPLLNAAFSRQCTMSVFELFFAKNNFLAKAGLEPVNTRVSTVGRLNHWATELVNKLDSNLEL